jgi:hypothetical protein
MKSLEEAYMEKKNENNLFVNKLLKEYFEDFCSAKQLMENPKKLLRGFGRILLAFVLLWQLLRYMKSLSGSMQ